MHLSFLLLSFLYLALVASTKAPGDDVSIVNERLGTSETGKTTPLGSLTLQ